MSEPIRVLVVDDEPLARINLRALLRKAPDVKIAAECPNGPAAVKFLSENAVDLVFLDVQMPEMNGFEVIAGLEPPLPEVIFVTAFDKFAVQAFEVNALDYLLKPIDDARFATALDRARARLRSEGSNIEQRLRTLLETRGLLPRRIAVRTGSRVLLLEVADIDFIRASDYYSEIHIGGKVHLLREPMKELEARLDPRMFVRIHRSAIVNIKRVRELRSRVGGGYDVRLENGESLPLSRSRSGEVQARFKRG